MIEKFFESVWIQAYYQTGNTMKNIVMASYNNDFSVDYLKEERYSEMWNSVFFACCDLTYGVAMNAYTPFLNTICDAFKEFGEGRFEDFLEECGVYSLHQEILSSYYYTGICERIEPMLPDEVEYEQKRMTEGIANLLIKLGEIKPIFMVINRFNLVSQSSIDVIIYLMEHPTDKVGIVLASNDTPFIKGEALEHWNTMLEILRNNNQIYHIGSSGKIRHVDNIKLKNRLDQISEMYKTLSNCYHLLEFGYIEQYLQYIERQAVEEELVVAPEWMTKLCSLYAMVSIMTQNYAKALETISRLRKIDTNKRTKEALFNNMMLLATCYMYLGRLKKAGEYADKAGELAQALGEEKYIFREKLLKAQLSMSGWHNIFFCANDVTIDEELIELMLKYNFRNHLAHIYIFAYDNSPEAVAKAYRTDESLLNFDRGVELAKELGNEILVYNAYQKNIMIASTFGMNEIALLYTVRTYQYIKDTDAYSRAKIYVGIGYNLSALGHNELAQNYYDRAIEIFYDLRRAEDIAEVNYNIGLNYIMMEDFKNAGKCLNETMNTVERLHLNSIRVCNLSKLYGLLAVVSILDGDRFDCERNLQNCKQFLSYVIIKAGENKNEEVLHDYARCDDDMFLYSYATALINFYDGDREAALDNFKEAETYLQKAEGNQFYAYDCFRRSRLLVFESMGKVEMFAKESEALKQHQEMMDNRRNNTSLEILEQIQKEVDKGPCSVTKRELDLLVKQAGTERDYLISKRQLDFMATWQNFIDLGDDNAKEMVTDAIYSFLTFFDNDKALFIRYSEDEPTVLFNNTGVELDQNKLIELYKSMDGYPNGYAVSKISENFYDHKRDISIFGIDEVYSFAVVPCYTDGRVQSIFITYIQMKDNWHNSINSYMLDNDDLVFYRLIFKELNNAINLNRVTKILEESAHIDMLTGIYNRVGMYREAERLEKKIQQQENKGISVMFLDVDNFKPYNDTFGHDVGDAVLREMARIFKSVAGDDGFVCRYGGDEFIIIVNCDDHDRLSRMAQDILDKVAQASVFNSYAKKQEGMKPLSCSIGITTNHGDVETSVDSMIKQADDLMYRVKTSSKGTYTFLCK